MSRQLRDRIRWLLPRLILAAASALTTLLALEIAYRVRLHRLLDTSSHRFQVHARNIYAFDREFGYAYVAGANSRVASVENGKVHSVWQSVVNPSGNIGDPAISADWEQTRHRVLVVGDSFTANPNYGGIAWPDYCYRFLKQELEQDVALQNFGRDGYGVLQMVHLAAEKAEQLRPHALIVAFISDDLTRDRFWRTPVTEGLYQRVFTTTSPNEFPSEQARAETILVNPDVEQLKTGDKADTLVAQYHALSRDSGLRRERRLVSLSESLLWNRLVRGDPFSRPVEEARNPRHPLRDFRDDDQFVEDVAKLNRTAIPIHLVWIPTHDELAHRAYDADPRITNLVSSLEAAFERGRLIRVLDGMDLDADTLRRAFYVPQDHHPTAVGAELYGAAIGRALPPQGSAK